MSYEMKNWKEICEEKDREIQRLNEALITTIVYLEMCEEDMKSIIQIYKDLYTGICSKRLKLQKALKLIDDVYRFYLNTSGLIKYEVKEAMLKKVVGNGRT